MVVILGGLGAYWWFKFGRHGAEGFYKKMFGLREGEQITSMWVCYYDIDRTTGEKVGELLGMHTRGINVMMALTSLNRMVIGDNEKKNPPMGFERGQVAVASTRKRRK